MFSPLLCINHRSATPPQHRHRYDYWNVRNRDISFLRIFFHSLQPGAPTWDYYKLVHAKRQDAAERGVEALYLFDGPPPFPPPHREKMVPESDVVQRDLQTS
ncbi:hypothetical protein PC116_g11266 [Phytophthora cactorum]|nr:hypothetical protein PC116_g11266 [Phytophthora cactorum]